jgi:hypothetical protein
VVWGLEESLEPAAVLFFALRAEAFSGRGVRIEPVMAKPEKIYAVLTGDLIQSSRLAPEQSRRAMAWLKERAVEFGALRPDLVIGRMDSFRHDSWQLLLSEPALALRCAVFLRAALRAESDPRTKYDCRIAVGIGTVEHISRRSISDSQGSAFVLSGRGLDEMGRRRICLHADPEEGEWSWVAGVVTPLLEVIVSDWTPTEARAVLGALLGQTHDEIARKWPMADAGGKGPTRQAVSAALSRAHWNSVDEVLTWMERRLIP